MRTEETKTRANYQWDSLRALGTWLETAPRTWRQTSSESHTPSKSWDLGTDYSDSVRMCKAGWPEGAAKVQRKLAKLQTRVRGPKTRNDFAGFRPNVPRYCGGAPDCMVSKRGDKAQGRVIHLYVQVDANGSVSAEHMANYGVAVAQYVRQLEIEGTRVELHAASATSGGYKRVGFDILIKRASQPLDLAVVAFTIGHPAMLRRIQFAMLERCGAPEISSYGRAVPIQRGDFINLPTNAVLLNGMADAGKVARTPEAAADHVETQINNQLSKSK